MTNPIKKLIIRDLIRDQIKRIAIEARKEAEEKLGTSLALSHLLHAGGGRGSSGSLSGFTEKPIRAQSKWSL